MVTEGEYLILDPTTPQNHYDQAAETRYVDTGLLGEYARYCIFSRTKLVTVLISEISEHYHLDPLTTQTELTVGESLNADIGQCGEKARYLRFYHQTNILLPCFRKRVRTIIATQKVLKLG